MEATNRVLIFRAQLNFYLLHEVSCDICRLSHLFPVFIKHLPSKSQFNSQLHTALNKCLSFCRCDLLFSCLDFSCFAVVLHCLSKLLTWHRCIKCDHKVHIHRLANVLMQVMLGSQKMCGDNDPILLSLLGKRKHVLPSPPCRALGRSLAYLLCVGLICHVQAGAVKSPCVPVEGTGENGGDTRRHCPEPRCPGGLPDVHWMCRE